MADIIHDVVPWKAVFFDPENYAGSPIDPADTLVLRFPDSTAEALPDGTQIKLIGRTASFKKWNLRAQGSDTIQNPLRLSVTAADVALQNAIYPQLEYLLDGGVWKVSASNGVVVGERFSYTGANLLLDQNTQIPLTADTTLTVPDNFVVNAGNLECVIPYAGRGFLVAYLVFDITANNRDAKALVQLTTISGAPTINQGHGVAGGAASPRANEIPFSLSIPIGLICDVGDIVGLIGSDDVAQSGLSYVVAETGVELD